MEFEIDDDIDKDIAPWGGDGFYVSDVDKMAFGKVVMIQTDIPVLALVGYSTTSII